jgi:thiamine biosynthesis lipoprotein
MAPRRSVAALVVLAVVVLAAIAALRAIGGRPAALPPAVAGSDFPTFRGEAMSTTVAVTLPASPFAADDAAAVVELFQRLEEDLSEWREGSPLAEANRQAGGAPVAVPADLLELVERSLAIAEATDGAFDPTWAALWGLWDFGAERPVVPGDEAIARRAALVDWRRLEVDRQAETLRLPEAGMKIGLGGIAKGFALDRAAAMLRQRGVEDFLLVAGGQVYAAGRRGERPWRIGVRDPRGDPDEVLALLELADESASTSGDYESYFVVDGVRYHHVLDPRTGRPASGLESATVVAADATLADALSTAVMVLGRERGLALIEGWPGGGVEAAVVDDAGRLTSTPGLTAKLQPPG